jgi:hypothetical protein
MGEEHDEDLEIVEVERMPDFGGWEYFKAMDGAEERERWTLGVRHAAGDGKIEYALWTDPKKDPEATGFLDLIRDKGTWWAAAIREAAENTELSGFDNISRETVVSAVLERHDKTFKDYKDRLVFELEPPEDDEDDEDERDDEDDDEEEEDEGGQ